MGFRRVVITGMGVVAAAGVGIEEFWRSLIRGQSGIRRIARFDVSSYPSQIGGEVLDFDPTDFLDPKTTKKLGRFAQFIFAAAQMAVDDSEIRFDREDPYRAGVYVGTALGGVDVIETQHLIFMEKGFKRISPFAVVSSSTHSASGAISCHYNLKGSNTTVTAGCNSGLDAAFLAYNAIRLGDEDLMIVGAGEAPLTPFSYAAFCASGFLSREIEQPHRALKPYDTNADGMVLGEGGGAVVMEELEHALHRGARIYAEVLSYSSLNEAFDLYGVDTEYDAMAHNFSQALDRGKVKITEIDLINAHGNGILAYDISETEAIKEAFGEFAPVIPVTSIKPVTGHAIAATGLFQIISSVLSMRHGVIPPTLNLEHPDPKCDLRYVTGSMLPCDVGTVMISAHGFGGRLTAMVLRTYPRTGGDASA